MKEKLFASASEWCEKSIESYLNNNEKQFFVQAGVAFELLGKSFLSSIHPSLIVNSNDFDSLLQVCGVVTHSKQPSNIKTIGASDVLVRVIQLLPSLKSYSPSLTELAKLRNSEVHLGNSATDILSKIALDYFRADMILIEACKQEKQAFFKNQTEFVQKLLADSVKEIEKNVATKIARSKLKYKERHSNLDKELITALQELLLDKQGAQYTEVCPSCQNNGAVFGEYEAKWDEGGKFPFLPNEILLINRFECRLCDLILAGRDEIIVAKLPEKMDANLVSLRSFKAYENHIDSGQE